MIVSGNLVSIPRAGMSHFGNRASLVRRGRPSRGRAVDETREREILESLSAGGAEGWNHFLDAYADVIFRVAGLFADSHDERMDLFLHACDRLRQDDMRRIRSFRFRPDAPCRFSTYLAVIVKNIAVDHLRSKSGRYRPFRTVESLDETDRLLFEYHLRDGRPLEEARALIEGRHGIRLGAAEASERASRIQSRLSANQRWKLLARLAERRRPVPIDPVSEAAVSCDRPIPLESDDGDPERSLRSKDAEEILRTAMNSMPARQRLALTLRYRDGLSPREVAAFLVVSQGEAERLTREGIEALRSRVARSGVAKSDLESAGLTFLWSQG